MGAESQALLTFGSQHDLVIGICQVNLRKTIPTTSASDLQEVAWGDDGVLADG